MDIPVSIVDSAVNCGYNKACLDLNGFIPCEVKQSVNDKVIFVNNKREGCNYCMSFGNEFVCLCPIRKELYLNHNT